MIPAVVKAVAADIFRRRVILVLRAATITKLADTVFSGRAVFMFLSHIDRADLYARHIA